MQVFINECSLHSQYYTSEQFTEAIKEFIDCLDVLKEQKTSQAYRSESLYLMNGLNNTNISTALSKNSDLTVRFKDAIQKNNIKSWEANKVHFPGISYVHNQTDYNGFSIAEFAERSIQDHNVKGFLLNFVKSKFSDSLQIDVLKGNEISVQLDCNYNANSITAWLIANGYIDPKLLYNEKAKIPPTDEQTVLSNIKVFERTTYPKNNGRTVYKRIGTDQLWVVDSSIKHANDKAHIEVFHMVTRKHLGTSLYNEIKLNENFKVPNRYITLE